MTSQFRLFSNFFNDEKCCRNYAHPGTKRAKMANLVSTGQKCLQHIYFPSPCIHYNTSKCCHIAAVIDIHKEICTFYCSSFCVVMFVVQTRWGYQLEKSKTSMNPKNMMQNQHYKLMWVHFPCFCILFSSNRSMTE